MNFFGILRLAFVSLLVAVSMRVMAAPPLEAYGDLPEVEDIVLSPDGTRYALLGTSVGERFVGVFDSNHSLIRRIDAGDLKIRSIEFINDDLLLLQRSSAENLGFGFAQDKFDFRQAVLVPLGAGEVELVFGQRSNMINAVFGYYGMRTVDGYPKAYFGGIALKRSGTGASYVFDHGRPGLYEVDLLTNRGRRIAYPAEEGHDGDWLVDAGGNVLVRFDIHTDSGRWKISNASGRTIAEGRNEKGHAGLVATGRDGSTIIYFSRDANGEGSWFEVPVDGSAEPKEFLPGVDVQRIFTDRATGRLTGYLRDTGEREPEFYADGVSKRVSLVQKTFPDLDPRLIDWTPGMGRVIVRTNGNGDSGTYFLVDLEALRADPIANERTPIGPEDVGPISTVAYTAGDGLELDGILTLPPGREPEDLPLVMLPHGGPHSSDTAGFDWMAQAFASRGYAVFQPNFRGSTNRDDAFRRMGDGQWGGKMQTDLSDGLAKLAQDGIVDPDRACIVGASYGGYAALAGVTLQHGLYRCAVSIAGVSDVALMSRTEKRESGNSRIRARSLEEQLGPRSEYKAISPRYAADTADAPILLIHGRDDTVVDFTQSAKMADALDDAGKPYEFVELEGEDHWLSQARTRKAMLQAAVAFVEKNNPPD